MRTQPLVENTNRVSFASLALFVTAMVCLWLLAPLRVSGAIIPVSCDATGNNDGCVVTASCPAGQTITKVRVACNLEYGATNLSDVRWGEVLVTKPSHIVSDGLCAIDPLIQVSVGSMAVRVPVNMPSLTFRAKEHDQNGGDVSLRGEIACEDKVSRPIPEPPTSVPGSGTYDSAQQVALTSKNSTSIRYVLNNTNINCVSGLVYDWRSKPTIAATSVLTAIGCSDAGASAVSSFKYVIGAPTSSPPQVRRIRVLNWNIGFLHAGKYNDKDYLQEIAEEIRAINADVVTLQEVDVNSGRGTVGGKKIDQARQLAITTNYPYYQWYKFTDLSQKIGSGAVGVAILSKYPIKHTEEFTLTQFPDRKANGIGEIRRVLARAIISIPGPTGDVDLFTTHLQFSDPVANSTQASDVAKIIAGERKGLPIILTGDFNAADTAYFRNRGFNTYDPLRGAGVVFGTPSFDTGSMSNFIDPIGAKNGTVATIALDANVADSYRVIHLANYPDHPLVVGNFLLTLNQ